MGARPEPGRPGRLDGGGQPAGEFDAIAEWGHGQRDPFTGAFEWYEDIPPEILADPEGEGQLVVSWTRIDAVSTLLIADFQSEYGIELEPAMRIRPWRWFEQRVHGLLAADTRLARHFAAAETPDDDGG